MGKEKPGKIEVKKSEKKRKNKIKLVFDSEKVVP